LKVPVFNNQYQARFPFLQLLQETSNTPEQTFD